VLAGLVALHVRRAPRSIRFWMVVATLLAYLTLVAIGLDPARAPNASRYVYIGSILTLLLVAELAADIRWSTVTGLVAFAIFGLALMANLAELRAGGRLFQAEGATNRATLAALELSREHVDPDLPVEGEGTTHSHPDMLFPAWAYFEATAEHGSPAFSLEELSLADPQSREAADQELVRAYALAAEPAPAASLSRRGAPLTALGSSGGRIAPAGPCLRLLPEGGSGSFRFEIPAGGFAYGGESTAPLELKLARFGDGMGETIAATAGTAEVAVPTDASGMPWRVELSTDGDVLACPR